MPSSSKDNESDIDDEENHVEVAHMLQYRSGVDSPIPGKRYLLGIR